MKTSKQFKTAIKVLAISLWSIIAGMYWLQYANQYSFADNFPLIFFDYISSWKMLSAASVHQCWQLAFLMFNIVCSTAIVAYVCHKLKPNYVMGLLGASLLYFGVLYSSNPIHQCIQGYMDFTYDFDRTILAERLAKRGEYLRKLEIANASERAEGLSELTISSKTKRNLVIIVLESVDSSWLTFEHKNLMPNTKALMVDNVNFTDIRQSRRGWDSENGFNDALTANNVISITDILHKANYRQVAMAGFPYIYASYGEFLKKKGYDDISCIVRRDADLFKDALAQYKQLSKTKQLFNLTIVTKDTHAPGWSYDGFNAGNREQQILARYKILDRALYNFIVEAKKYNDLQNTVVAVFNDHYAWKTGTALDHRKEIKNRKMVFFVIDGSKRQITTRGTTANIGASILQICNVKHNNGYLNKYCLIRETNPFLKLPSTISLCSQK